MKHDRQKNENAKRILKQAGYSTKSAHTPAFAKGGAVHEDEAQDKKLIKKMVKKQDLKKEKKAEGGFVHGGMPKKRLDKISRQTTKEGDQNTTQPYPPGKEKFAKGGAAKGKDKTQVNVIIGHGGQPQPGQPMPVPVPAGGPPMGAPPQAMPPRPPMAPPGMPAPGAGGPPPGMPMRAKGGSVSKHVPKMEFGAAGGLGRIEKAKEYGKKPKK